MPVKAHKASDRLKSREDAAAYLKAALEEMGDDPRLLMKALRNVAEARGSVSTAGAGAGAPDAGGNPGGAIPRHPRNSPCVRHRTHG